MGGCTRARVWVVGDICTSVGGCMCVAMAVSEVNKGVWRSNLVGSGHKCALPTSFEPNSHRLAGGSVLTLAVANVEEGHVAASAAIDDAEAGGRVIALLGRHDEPGRRAGVAFPIRQPSTARACCRGVAIARHLLPRAGVPYDGVAPDILGDDAAVVGSELHALDLCKRAMWQASVHKGSKGYVGWLESRRGDGWWC